MLRARVVVYGQVQGVNYRREAVKKARELQVKGWIRNLSDGRVETLIVGSQAPVKKMLSWLEKGSPRSKVEKVEVTSQEEINYNPFEEKFKINPTV